MALAARCPQHPGMTCHLHFYGWGQLPVLHLPLNKSVCAPRLTTVCQLSSLNCHLFG